MSEPRELIELKAKYELLQTQLEKENIELKAKYELLQTQLEKENEKLEMKSEQLGELRMQLKNHKYMKYCNVVRNEISKFDKYARATGFQYIQSDLDYIIEQGGTYEDVQEEKRKLRLCHIFRNSNEEEVTKVTSRIPPGMNSDIFAAKLARGYRLISEDIHKLSYSIEFEGQYCPTVTRDKEVNECLVILTDNIEFNVGIMIPRKRKATHDAGSST